MKSISFCLIGFAILMMACQQTETPSENRTKMVNEPIEKGSTNFYVGTYTRTEGHVDGRATGIYKLKIAEENGNVISHTAVATLINPSFLTYSPNKKYLYAVSELAHQDEPTGFIYALEVGTDSLKIINRLPTDAKAPCHVSVDQTGQFAFVANYVGGVAKMYRILENGALEATDKVQLEGKSAHPRQESPHLHSVIISPDNQLALMPDLGTDKIWIFRIDFDNGKLIPYQQPFLKIQEGAGPRHLVWSPKGDFCYVINELDNSVNVIQYNQDIQQFSSIQNISTLPDDFNGESFCADIRLHPNGQFLYGSNRGHNSIVMYRRDKETGKLTFLGTESTRGDFPRNFRVGPKGNFLYVANQNTSNITTYAIDQTTGGLTFAELDYPIPTPVCIEF